VKIKSSGKLIVALWLTLESLPAAAAPIDRELVTWSGNTIESNDRLGVTLMRAGCELPPIDCIRRIRSVATTQRVSRWSIALKRPAGQIGNDARLLSELSLQEPLLVQVDLDDFVRTMKSWHLTTAGRANGLLEDVARNIKLRNRRLQFGITLYEDEIGSPIIVLIPETTRGLVDRVSLYLHYRRNAEGVAEYVARVRQLFPNAAIWAGSYAYDRIDYLPCEQGGTRPCTDAEEIDLYLLSLESQLRLLKGGAVSGLEFYPGFFGIEDKWPGWSNRRICRPDRIEACIRNTRRMRELAVSALTRNGIISESPRASPR
jgi:hypothetical protein